MPKTIKDVASLASVSPATVSNVINGKGGMTEATRRKVESAALELNYPLRKRTRTMRADDQATIGVLFPRHSTAGDPNYYVSEVLAGVEERVNSLGYSLLIESHRGTDEFPNLLSQDPDGLLLIGGQFPESFIVRLAASEQLMVLIGTSTIKVPVHSVAANNRMGAFQATSHLLEFGHERVGLMNGPDTTKSSREKFEGFSEALASFGLTLRPEWVTSCDFAVEDSYEAAQRLLYAEDRPTAVFAGDDPIAIGAIRAFHQAGVSVPRDVAVVGYGNSTSGRYISPPLTTVEVFQREMGRRGADHLLDLMRKARTGQPLDEATHLAFSTRLLVRESCGALAAGEELGADGDHR